MTVSSLLLASALLLFPAFPAQGCNVCHSKNPKMVAMHRELGFRDCFNCHGQGLKKTPEARKAQQTSDNRCAGCHKK